MDARPFTGDWWTPRRATRTRLRSAQAPISLSLILSCFVAYDSKESPSLSQNYATTLPSNRSIKNQSFSYPFLPTRSRQFIRIRIETGPATHDIDKQDSNRIMMCFCTIPLHCRWIRYDMAGAKDLLVPDTLLSENLHGHGKPNTIM